jgi:ribosome-binding factor A
MTRQHGTEPSQRQLRVGEEIRHALARLLARGELRDPELFDVAITVTEVRMSPDLRQATAFVTPLGGSDMERIVAALRRAAPFLQGRIGREMRLRFTPALHFEEDRSFDEAGRIDRLLRGLDHDGGRNEGGDGG